MPQKYKSIPEGTRFNNLVVKKFAGVNNLGNALFETLCDCGKTYIAIGTHLRIGRLKTCGCYSPFKDIPIGTRFGKLTVERFSKFDEIYNAALFMCRCKCGKIIECKGAVLRSGERASCGSIRCEHLGDEDPFCANPNTIQNAYFSGHFDGEGCVRLSYGKNRIPTVVIRVSNIFKPTLNEYLSIFGGSITPGHNHGRFVWTWTLHRQSLIAGFIKSILPFSREKKEQLELALEFISKRNSTHKNRVEDSFVSVSDIYDQKITALKKIEYAN